MREWIPYFVLLLLVAAVAGCDRGSEPSKTTPERSAQSAPTNEKLGKLVELRTLLNRGGTLVPRADGSFWFDALETCSIGILQMDASMREIGLDGCRAGWVVDDDTLVFEMSDSSEEAKSSRFVATDSSGKVQFEFRAERVVPVASTIVAVRDDALVALGGDGKPLWELSADAHLDAIVEVASPGTPAPGLSIIGRSAQDSIHVRRVDSRSGNVESEARLSIPAKVLDVVGRDELVAVHGADGVLRVYDRISASAKPRWTAPIDFPLRPAVAKSSQRNFEEPAVYLGERFVFVYKSGNQWQNLWAYERESGKLRWRKRVAKRAAVFDHAGEVVTDYGSKIEGLNPATGELVWKYALGAEVESVVRLSPDNWLVGHELATDILSVNRHQEAQPSVIRAKARVVGVDDHKPVAIHLNGVSTRTDKTGRFEAVVPIAGRLSIDAVVSRGRVDAEAFRAKGGVETLDSRTHVDGAEVVLVPSPPWGLY